MVPADLPHCLEIAVRREQDPAGADDRLAEEGRDVLRAELLDRLLECLGGVPGNPGGATGERADADLERFCPDDAGSEPCETVVGTFPRDDRRTLGLSEKAPVAAHELHDGLDRLTAATGEEHGGVIHWCDRGDALRQVGRGTARDVAVVGVGMELAHLRGRRVCDLCSPVADVRIPEAARRVDVPVAGLVPEMAALGSVEDELPRLLDGVHVGDGMPEPGHGPHPSAFTRAL